MQTPKFRFEWNLNSIITTLTLIGLIAGGGAAWSDVTSRLLSTGKRLDTMEVTQSIHAEKLQELPLLKQQMGAFDRQFYDINSSAKETREVMNRVATQVEVMSQIMRRLEEAQQVRSGTNRNN